MNTNSNQIKNSMIIKGDIFSDYLNCNSFHSSLSNKEFAKPDNETFNKFFTNDENSIKSLNSLNDLSRPYISSSTTPHNKIENLFPSNNLDLMKGTKEKNNNEVNYNNKENIKKKNLFSTLSNKELTIEDKKQKRLIMNRESAKKSRLKKKNYIENLEKQYILLKEEFIKIREEQKLNNTIYNLKNQLMTNNNQNKAENKNNNLKQNSDIPKKLKKKYILENTINTNNTNSNNQKRLMIYLLINQIDIMTPIKIKSFQNKYLKMQVLDADDSIEIIKNKIKTNLDIILELYGMEGDIKYIPKLEFCDHKKSIAYQLYEYYKDIILLINQFENIYNNFDNK